jgi:hypothetical protein
MRFGFERTERLCLRRLCQLLIHLAAPAALMSADVVALHYHCFYRINYRYLLLPTNECIPKQSKEIDGSYNYSPELSLVG